VTVDLPNIDRAISPAAGAIDIEPSAPAMMGAWIVGDHNASRPAAIAAFPPIAPKINTPAAFATTAASGASGPRPRRLISNTLCLELANLDGEFVEALPRRDES
jgi:hypothetical protein